MMFCGGIFVFNDIMSMNAPQTYEQWSTSFKSIPEGKLMFPYEMLTSLDVLQITEFPPIECWSSWLKDKKMLKEEWLYMREVWRKNDFKNLGELLCYYNLLDIIPMLNALKNQKEVFRSCFEEEYSNFRSLAGFAEYYALKKAHRGKQMDLFPIFSKTHSHLYEDFMNSKQGGFSQVMCRYAEVGKVMSNGKVCKALVGYDANALYLWALSQSQPVDYYKYTDYASTHSLLSSDIGDSAADIILEMLGWTCGDIANKLQYGWNGFVKCDGVCEDLEIWKKMNFLPCFQGLVVNPDDITHIGENMYNYLQRNKIKKRPSRKLLNTAYVKETVLYAPYLRFLQKYAGFKITKVYYTIKTNARKVFHQFCEDVSDARRVAKINPSQAAVGLTFKTVGNSCYGRFGMDRGKFKKTLLAEADTLAAHQEDCLFIDSTHFGDETVEITRLLKKVDRKNPIMLSIGVYQMSKLRMLQFIYHLGTHCDGIMPMEGDTDSFYMALPAKTLDECVMPEMRDSWEYQKSKFFPPQGAHEYTKVEFMGEQHAISEKDYFNYERGLFKVEAKFTEKGSTGICLAAKCYRFCNPKGKVKMSHKGCQTSAINRINPLPLRVQMLAAREKRDEEEEAIIQKAIEEKNRMVVLEWKKCLEGNSLFCENRGIRCIEGRLTTYSQLKKACDYYYDKHIVADDGITCTFGRLHLP